MDTLTSAGLYKIKTHKYKGGAYTPLDNLLNPWWLWLTDLLPMWMAPNLVTLIGTLHVVLVQYICWPYIFPLTGAEVQSPSPAAMAGIAWCLFVYQTMDAMDGKQARRTGSSTPLGQLFDHGCDAYTLLVCVSITYRSFAHARLWPCTPI